MKRLALVFAVAIAGHTGCARVFDYPGSSPEQTEALCSDGEDNDLNGEIDCHDRQCAAFCLEDGAGRCHDGLDNDFDGDKDCEAAACARFCVEGTAETCGDGLDNDQDDRSDCGDPACAEFCPEAGAAACADRTDNDADGDVDCDDPDCDGHCPEANARECGDERDNDGDGLTDAADPRCWLLDAPQVQRCATARGADLVETFDGGDVYQSIAPNWLYYADLAPDGSPLAFFPKAHDRNDWSPQLSFNATATRTLEGDLPTLVGSRAFSGSWHGFELAFDVAVGVGTLLRVAIVPVELVPLRAAPLPGAEGALLTLTLDASQASPLFSLEAANAHASTELPITGVACGAAGECLGADAPSVVRLVLDAQGFHATLERPNGERAELRTPPPSSQHLPPSRLVVWGGSIDPNLSAAFDDVHLHVAPDHPCGVDAPQISGRSCEFRGALGAFGHCVALAADASGEHCALVSASREPGAFEPETVTAWTSRDGAQWTAASAKDAPAVQLPGDVQLIGAGIAHDGERFHVAVAYRDDREVRVGLATAKRCGGWGSTEAGPTLFPDAEAPSYVIRDGQHALYFTRPPIDGARRTLWRVVRGEDAWLEPHLLAELSADVAQPVSVRPIGTRDLVLVHPTAASDGNMGVGLLVGSDGGRTWSSVQPSPLLEIPKAFENFSGSIEYDDHGALGAALAWGERGGFLLYGASSARAIHPGLPAASILAAGTARVAPSGAAFPELDSAAETACGDGACDAVESCSSCAADCECDGPALLTDAFAPDAPWRHLAVLDGFESYLDRDRGAFNWAGGAGAWSALPLEQTVAGDFELSFDIQVTPTADSTFCSLYVGLAAGSDWTALADEGGAAIAAGAFAGFGKDRRCVTRYRAAPFVLLPHRDALLGAADWEEEGPADCYAGDVYFEADRWRRVVLRREAGRVSLEVERDDACGLFSQAIDYPGVLPELEAVLIGYAGGAFDLCDLYAGQGVIRDLRLRLLDDPRRCPHGEVPCGEGSQATVCVDFERTPEHCGACGHACAATEVCNGGRCECSDEEGVLACDGTCVDSLNDPANCGACGTVCPQACVQGSCAGGTGDCSSPLPLPAEGGLFPIDFAAGDSAQAVLCGYVATNVLVYSWTPAQNGIATIAVVAGLEHAALYGVTTDATCELVSACLDIDLQQLVVPVEAGTTYRIPVGLGYGDPATSTLALSIEVQ